MSDEDLARLELRREELVKMRDHALRNLQMLPTVDYGRRAAAMRDAVRSYGHDPCELALVLGVHEESLRDRLIAIKVHPEVAAEVALGIVTAVAREVLKH